MRKRNIDTIIAVMAGRTVWVDKTGEAIHSLDLDGHASAALTLTALFKTHPIKRGARVLLLSSDFFTQTVRLPAMQTHGLRKDELAAALVFEVEPFSNIPFAQGLAAYTSGSETADVQSWTVLQIARSEIQALQAAVGAAGGRLVGLAHAESAGLAPLPDPELSSRLRAMASQAEAPSAPFPVVFPAATGFGSKGPELAACLAFVLVCGACLAHALYTKTHVAALRQQAAQREALAACNAQAESVNASLRSRIDALERARAEREATAQTLSRYRTAWRSLMHGLLDSCDNTLVLQRIDGGALFEVEIGGLSTSEKAPGDYLAQLAERIGGGGWHIQSEALQPVASLGGQGPVRFTFRALLDLPGEARRPPQHAHTPEEG